MTFLFMFESISGQKSALTSLMEGKTQTLRRLLLIKLKITMM
ncbi:MAG: hypothetical protein RMJ03_04705 [Nitrososphaerota archaeon]|nr:hypothetical protein [Nitrososphaerota archaeon]